MLSLSSAKAGSRALRGWSWFLADSFVEPSLGVVVCDARRLVREGGRRGVVGRDGKVPERVREWEEVRDFEAGAGVVVEAIVVVEETY